jgi:DNA-binding NarL/FixJ family response regulator
MLNELVTAHRAAQGDQAPASLRGRTPIKVLIADDHPVVRFGLKALLEAHPDISVAAEARDGREAVERARDTDWDVAMVDYSMPGPSGVELVKEIKLLWPDRPVLVLGAYPDSMHGIQVMRAGAAGYVSKDSTEAELAGAVRKVACGGKYISAAFAQDLAEGVKADTGRPLHEALSKREIEVIGRLVTGKALNEISQELRLSASAVSTYRRRILRKLRISNNAQLVRYAAEMIEA